MSDSMEKIIESVWSSLKVESIIGRGASGHVYRVKKSGMGRNYHFAVKVIQIPKNPSELEELRSDGMDPQSIRFYYKDLVSQLSNEIDLMESLKSAPNIVSIEDFYVKELKERFGWVALIRMELLENLKTFIDRKGITEEGVWRLGYDLCTALDYCGKLGVIHRDIKPANVFVTQFGDFKLGDFGISRRSTPSIVRSTKGTFAYMAPEVAQGRSYDKTVDLYSLGVMMYRLLNNNRLPFLPAPPTPYSEKDIQLALTKRFAGDRMQPPANASPGMSEIILKACTFHSTGRYSDAREMKEALVRYREGLRHGLYVIPPGTACSTTKKLPPKENLSNGPSAADSPLSNHSRREFFPEGSLLSGSFSEASRFSNLSPGGSLSSGFSSSGSLPAGSRDRSLPSTDTDSSSFEPAGDLTPSKVKSSPSGNNPYSPDVKTPSKCYSRNHIPSSAFSPAGELDSGS